jgi:DNA-binding CsgD family transcriptional regulator
MYRSHSPVGAGHFCPLRRRARLDPRDTAASAPGRTGAVAVRSDPAEARVARSLSAGETVEKIASIGDVSLNTVRSQLRCVLEKTGCHRQAEVVALLSGIAVPQG